MHWSLWPLDELWKSSNNDLSYLLWQIWQKSNGICYKWWEKPFLERAEFWQHVVTKIWLILSSNQILLQREEVVGRLGYRFLIKLRLTIWSSLFFSAGTNLHVSNFQPHYLYEPAHTGGNYTVYKSLAWQITSNRIQMICAAGRPNGILLYACESAQVLSYTVWFHVVYHIRGPSIIHAQLSIRDKPFNKYSIQMVRKSLPSDFLCKY